MATIDTTNHGRTTRHTRSRWPARVVAASLLWNAGLTLRLLGRRAAPASRDPPAAPDGRRPRPGGPGTVHAVPDWRYAVDCSAWDNMCGATAVAARAYGPYPFPLGRHAKRLARFDHRSLADVPAAWRAALAVDNSLERPPPRPVTYVYPPRVGGAAEASRCVREATVDATWQEQLDRLLASGRIEREAATNMVAFTIGDFKYARDMLHDVFEMSADVVGFGRAFFLVALDAATVALACAHGYPVVAWPEDARLPGGVAPLKHSVASAKFRVSLHLVRRGVDFFFHEMDVWFLTSPRDLLAAYHREEGGDLLLSSHMGDPLAPNIGVYSAAANARTVEFFELCVKMAEESPNTHDQWIMGQLLLLAWTITEMGAPGVKFTRMWYPPPEHNPPTMKHPPTWGMYNTMEIMAGETPIPTKNTLAIHPLCKGPLKDPFGKKILAKELGAWTGFTGSGVAGYYARTGTHRRYLWMDGHDSPNAYNTVQSFEWDALNAESLLVRHAAAFRWTMAVLLALARRTGRIFQMPRLLSEEGAHYLWTVLDFAPVEDMGIDYRETNFPHNRKAWHSEATPFRSVARTALAPLKGVDKENAMYVQYPSKATGLRGDVTVEEEITKAWRFATNTTEEQALDAWWALHTALPEVDAAELLLVNPHFVSGYYTNLLQAKLQDRTHAPASVAETEIFAVFRRLRWCPGAPIVAPGDVVGRASAERTCHGKGRPSAAFG